MVGVESLEGHDQKNGLGIWDTGSLTFKGFDFVSGLREKESYNK